MQNFLFTSDIFKGSRYEPGHPLDMDRVWPSVELIQLMGWVKQKQIIKNEPADLQELTKFHDKDYVQALKNAERDQYLSETLKIKYNIGIGNNPIFKEVFSRPASAAKASIQAVEMIASQKANKILNISGGTHHGRKSQAYGFCFLNDCVLAILKAIELGFSKILYVDIDAHHCDGVQDVFAHNDKVRVVSIHEQNRWPKTGTIQDCKINNILNFPVPADFNDSELDFLIKYGVIPFGNHDKPDLLIIQAGADMLDGDPQSRISLTNNAYWKAIKDILSLCDKSIILGGGGYNPYLTAKAWAGNWALLNNKMEWLDLEMNLECQSLLKSLQWKNSRVRNGIPENWYKKWRDPISETQVSKEVSGLLDKVLNIKKYE
jgi:acetoin utilization protein AcuC|tara:strand:+ start:2325 stop:3452 length:1128 start_codon:yes stop_codon:yes gene_type:complete